jgi:hypothetical protein
MSTSDTSKSCKIKVNIIYETDVRHVVAMPLIVAPVTTILSLIIRLIGMYVTRSIYVD